VRKRHCDSHYVGLATSSPLPQLAHHPIELLTGVNLTIWHRPRPQRPLLTRGKDLGSSSVLIKCDEAPSVFELQVGLLPKVRLFSMASSQKPKPVPKMFTFYALFGLSGLWWMVGLWISNPVKCFLAERNAGWQIVPVPRKVSGFRLMA